MTHFKISICHLFASILCWWGYAEKTTTNEKPILAVVHDMEMGIALCNTTHDLDNIKTIIRREITAPFAMYPHLERHLNDLYNAILIRECEIMANKERAAQGHNNE